MSPFLIFILGVILSSVFWSILNLLLRRKRVIKGEKAKLKEESNHRTKEKFDPDSESLQTIKLKKLDKPQDAYYQNDEVFITFCLEELKKQSINIRTLANALRPAEGFQMIEFKIINRTYSLLLAEILESGNVIVYSKIEGKLVNEIKKDKRRFLDQSSLSIGYGYYLPDGTLFLSNSAQEIQVNLRRKENIE